MIRAGFRRWFVIEIFLLLLSPGLIRAGIVFEDGFESGTLGPAWNVSTTQDGRVTVSATHAPASGQRCLVLDDAVDDGIYSVAQATLHLNLLQKKNVVLSFMARSLGNEPDYNDHIAFSTDGGVSWHEFHTYWSPGMEWGRMSFRLDSYLSFFEEAFGQDFRIRFSEYDNASAPIDGIAIDDVVVTADDDQRAVVELPTSVLEGTGPHAGYVLLAFPSSNALTLSLSSSLPDEVLLPEQVEIPPGSTSASFEFWVRDDSLANLRRNVSVSATGWDVVSVPGVMQIMDDDMPRITLELPAQVKEDGYYPITVVLDRPLARDANLYVHEPLKGGVYISEDIPAGMLRVPGLLVVHDNLRIEGDVEVSLVALLDWQAVATNHIVILDNDRAELRLALPTEIQEGQSALGAVRLSGTVGTNLYVNLSSTNPTVNLPRTVMIPADAMDVQFSISVPDNDAADGTRSTAIYASAPGFVPANAAVLIRDNEIAGYRFSPLSNLVITAGSIPVSISAADVEGNLVNYPTGAVHLSLVLPNGTRLPVTPGTVTFWDQTGWSGDVVLPSTSASPLRLMAEDDQGRSCVSTEFDPVRAIALTAGDLVWDSARSRFYASIPNSEGGTNANCVVAIDPITGEISGRVPVGQDPGPLAIASDGASLYVGARANGTVVRIDLDAFTVMSSFSVVTNTSNTVLCPMNIEVVPGQPDLVVVSYATRYYYESGVGAFENGIARPKRIQTYGGPIMLQPSTSPNVFFSHLSGGPINRLHLDSDGLRWEEMASPPAAGLEIVSVQNKVFSSGGAQVDGDQLALLGTFATSGPVQPILEAKRVLFIEKPTMLSVDWLIDGANKIGLYDLATHARIRQATFSQPVISPKSFIRWETNGIAFLDSSRLFLIRSRQLIPDQATADLVLTMEADPKRTQDLTLITYTLVVSNQGPETAVASRIDALVLSGQEILSATCAKGSCVISGNSVSVDCGNLPMGATVVATIRTLPDRSGIVACTATASSCLVDPEFTNNCALDFSNIGFHSVPDSANVLDFSVNNLLYDPTRGLLWATTPSGNGAPFSRTLVSIDPATGFISDPIPLDGNPIGRCLAISANGRYAYVGLSEGAEIERIDVGGDFSRLRIPMSSGLPKAIAPLPGDGTSFLVAAGYSLAAFDGVIQRSNWLNNQTITQVDPTADSGSFVANGWSGCLKITVNSGGVDFASPGSLSVSTGGASMMHGEGDLVLFNSGYLLASSNLSLIADFRMAGSPCVDIQNQRAYLLSDNGLYTFEVTLPFAERALLLPPNFSPNSYSPLVRCGLDGLATYASDSLCILRWSGVIPPSKDADADNLSDAWEATWFSTLACDPAADDDGDGLRNFQEFVFGTSPVDASVNPMRATALAQAGGTSLRLLFPRRAGLPADAYTFEVSSDLLAWTEAEGVTQAVVSTEMINGVQIETVDAIVPGTNSGAGFVRWKWNPHVQP